MWFLLYSFNKINYLQKKKSLNLFSVLYLYAFMTNNLSFLGSEQDEAEFLSNRAE